MEKSENTLSSQDIKALRAFGAPADAKVLERIGRGW